ncbi:YcaO-like family protein [bacterium]|nr:YcaO-like family protein [bacterium]
MTFYRHPYRHYWPLSDKRTLVWSPSLGETVALENSDLWPMLYHLRSLPGESLEVEGDLLVMANFLVTQGYLLHHPWSEQPDYATDYDGVVIWNRFDFDGWMDYRSARPHFHLFPGIGQDQGWCFWDGQPGACLRCQVLRWLANRDYSKQLIQVRAARQAWGDWPYWGALDHHALDMLSKAQTHRGSLIWEGQLHWLCQPAPLPGCLCGQGAPTPTTISRPQASTNWQWFNPLGVICQTRCDSGQEHLWGARSGWVSLLGGADDERSSGAGCHPDPETAFRQAVGETLERYCARFLPPQAPPQLPPLVWTEFSPQQIRQPKFTYRDSAQFQHWCAVQPLAGGLEWKAPTQAMLLCTPPGEPQVYPNLSHGLGCQRSLELALWGALWECLERDAVASWWAQLCSSGGQTARGRCESKDDGLEVYEIPCLAGRCAVAWTCDAQGRRAGGSAASLDERCFTKAIQESRHNFRCLNEGEVSSPRPDPPVTFRQHLETYWAQPQRFPADRLKRMADLPPFRPCGSTPESIAACLAEEGIHLYWTELTTADVAALDHRVVKVFSPQLLYLPAQHQHWPLGRKRYRQLVGHNQLPRLPHPFA